MTKKSLFFRRTAQCFPAYVHFLAAEFLGSHAGHCGWWLGPYHAFTQECWLCIDVSSKNSGFCKIGIKVAMWLAKLWAFSWAMCCFWHCNRRNLPTNGFALCQVTKDWLNLMVNFYSFIYKKMQKKNRKNCHALTSPAQPVECVKQHYFTTKNFFDEFLIVKNLVFWCWSYTALIPYPPRSLMITALHQLPKRISATCFMYLKIKNYFWNKRRSGKNKMPRAGSNQWPPIQPDFTLPDGYTGADRGQWFPEWFRAAFPTCNYPLKFAALWHPIFRDFGGLNSLKPRSSVSIGRLNKSTAKRSIKSDWIIFICD